MSDSLGAGPRIQPDPTDPVRRLVTLRHRPQQPVVGVHARLNRITDKESAPLGMMSPAEDGWWSITLTLPADLRCSYQFIEIPTGTSAEVVAGLGGRGAGLGGIADPGNPLQLRTTRPASSVLALDQAPPQPEWETIEADLDPGRGAVERHEQHLAGRLRPVWLRRPVEQALNLLVITDAEAWFDGHDLPGALAAAEHSGRIAPTAVLGVANLDTPDRVGILGGRTALVDDLVTLLGDLRQQGVLPALPPSRTVVSGQSLGGLTALFALAHAPEVFGLALAHSPSMWWRPDPGASPRDLGSATVTWVVDTLGAAEVPTGRARIDVGSLEGSMATRADALTERLRDRGWAIECHHYTGGHDHACWRGALIEGLATLP